VYKRQEPTLAKFCGILFSLGHGGVVIAIAITVSLFASNWEPPDWLISISAITSFLIIAMLGIMNLYAVFTSKPGQSVPFVGIRSKLLISKLAVSKPIFIALVGSVFAFSFDTVSQAVFFALTSSYFGGWQNALLLATVFTLGMLLTDGINGFWISSIIHKTDSMTILHSRILTLVVGFASLLVALSMAMKYFFPQFDAWAENKELLLGVIVFMIVAGGYAIPLKLMKGRNESS